MNIFLFCLNFKTFCEISVFQFLIDEKRSRRVVLKYLTKLMCRIDAVTGYRPRMKPFFNDIPNFLIWADKLG